MPPQRSSCDIISRVLQDINDGNEVKMQAAFAAAIFQSLASRTLELKSNPQQHAMRTVSSKWWGHGRLQGGYDDREQTSPDNGTS